MSDSLSATSSSRTPVITRQTIEAPPPGPTPAPPSPSALETNDASTFERAPNNPVSLTGAPSPSPALPEDPALKAELQNVRFGAPKPVNPQAVPLDYVEKGGAVIRQGQSGDSVKQLQETLNREGASPPLDPNGKFDAKMEAAVKEFQKKQGLPDDGRVGGETLARLLPNADQVKTDPRLSKLDPATQKELSARLAKDPKDYAAREALMNQARAPGFDQLKPEQQAQLLKLHDTAPSDPALAKDLKALSGSSEFRSLPAEHQKLALEQLGKHAGDATARGTLTKLVTNPGFAKMESKEQGVMLHQMGGKNTVISGEARKALETKLGGLSGKSADEQKAGLSEFLHKQEWPDWSTWDKAWQGRTSPPTGVTGPTKVTDAPFNAGAGPADLYKVQCGSKTVDVFVPPGTSKADVDKLVETMGALPQPNREVIDRIVLEPNDRILDSGGKAGFDALKGTVRAYPEGMAYEPKDKRMSAMVHESAHLIDEKMGEVDPKWNENWRKAVADDIAKPSQYGKTSMAEDFAEAYLTYKLFKGTAEGDEMKAMFPERWRLIEDVERRAQAGELRK
ncbi:MAG: peptidoglycan-binding protein [Myxococcaceae bacterium]|nr:peptidoglycan-binding protein [Myxococcaceae bacterium]